MKHEWLEMKPQVSHLMIFVTKYLIVHSNRTNQLEVYMCSPIMFRFQLSKVKFSRFTERRKQKSFPMKHSANVPLKHGFCAFASSTTDVCCWRWLESAEGRKPQFPWRVAATRFSLVFSLDIVRRAKLKSSSLRE